MAPGHRRDLRASSSAEALEESVPRHRAPGLRGTAGWRSSPAGLQPPWGRPATHCQRRSGVVRLPGRNAWRPRPGVPPPHADPQGTRRPERGPLRVDEGPTRRLAGRRRGPPGEPGRRAGRPVGPLRAAPPGLRRRRRRTRVGSRPAGAAPTPGDGVRGAAARALAPAGRPARPGFVRRGLLRLRRGSRRGLARGARPARRRHRSGARPLPAALGLPPQGGGPGRVGGAAPGRPRQGGADGAAVRRVRRRRPGPAARPPLRARAGGVRAEPGVRRLPR